jgi:hypothetical protein
MPFEGEEESQPRNKVTISEGLAVKMRCDAVLERIFCFGRNFAIKYG